MRPILRERWGRRRDREGDDRVVAAMSGEPGVEVVVAENGLPTASVPVTVASKLVSAARSAPATLMLQVVPSGLTVPL